MHHRSHRHSECCESRCQPPISWPQRPSLPSFPGIGIFWPMPSLIPMWPSVGSWGGMRSGYEPREYSNRRFDMDRYRCCEPRCCERCGEYDCRCGSCCERCGEYNCRCGRSRYSRPVEVVVQLGANKLNYAISINQEYFNSNVWPRVTDLVGDATTNTIAAPQIHIRPDAVEIIVALDAKTKIAADNYSAKIYDRNKPAPPVPIAILTLNVF